MAVGYTTSKRREAVTWRFHEDTDGDEDDVEEDTGFEEERRYWIRKEEEDLPASRETPVEQSHREFWDVKERLKKAVHIELINKKYMDGLMSRDELARTPTRYLRIVSKRKAVILSLKRTTNLSWR